jgi:Arc/MetJ-type ribon-helix-helix transcriptional regulator
MPQIAVRLTEDELAGLDRLVADRHYDSRAAAIRDALAQVLKAEEDRRIAKAYERAYGGRPPTQEEIDVGITGEILLAQAYEETGEPPWDEEEQQQPDPKPDIRWWHEVEILAEHLLSLVHNAAEQQKRAS